MLKIRCITICFSVVLIFNIVYVTYVFVPYLKLFIAIIFVAGLVDMSHQNPHYCAIFRRKGRFPEEWDEDAPMPRSLPVPNCICNFDIVRHTRSSTTHTNITYSP
jgi:hypothetical protein